MSTEGQVSFFNEELIFHF